MILPTTVSGSPGTLAAMDKNQLPAIVRGALKAYTPGFGLASGTNAVSISAPRSCAMTMRIWTITASVTGLALGLWSNRTAMVATLLDLILSFDGLEHVVVCPSPNDIGQGHEDRYRSAS